MASLHVNSASVGAASPYDTWVKAATTLGVAAAAAGAGDTIYVHASHAETGTVTVTSVAGTHASPIKIICGSPGEFDTVGISTGALATTATITCTSGTLSFSGSTYVYGIIFIVDGSTSTATFNSVGDQVVYFENCKFRNATTGTIHMVFGSSSSTGNFATTLRNCQFKLDAISQTIRVNSHVIIQGGSFESGTTSPTTCFILGTGQNGSQLYVEGFDFSNLGTGFDVADDSQRCNFAILRNCKMPAGWVGALSASDFTISTQVKMLNYGDGATNHKFWIEDHYGIVKDETTIKMPTTQQGATDGVTNYSWRMKSLGNVSYPSTIFRSPPIQKRIAAGATTLQVEICHDGATAYTNKEVWVEFEYLGASGFPLSVHATNRPDWLSAAAQNGDSGIPWDGDTGTGPNGSAVWHQLELSAAVTLAEEGYAIATVCMAIPNLTIFINPDIL